MSSNPDIDKMLKDYVDPNRTLPIDQEFQDGLRRQSNPNWDDEIIEEDQKKITKATQPYNSVFMEKSTNEIQFNLKPEEIRFIDTLARRWNVSFAFAYERIMRDALKLYVQNLTIFEKLYHNSPKSF